MSNVHGQCSCGSVAYIFVTENLVAYQCHCSVCRKATGSAFSTTLLVPEMGFQWLRGEELVTTYTKEGGYRLDFCSKCGSPVPNMFRGFPLFSVPVGSIEGKPDIAVTVHLHLRSRARWDKASLDGRHFDEMPTVDEMLELLGINQYP